jgi:ATP-binding cassette subfamily B protein
MKHIFKLLASARELKQYYVIISILSVLSSVMLILFPVLTGWVIDEVRHGTQARISYVIGLAVAMFVLDFLVNVINNYNGYLGDQMSAKLQRTLSQRYFEHLLKLPQAYFDKELSGKIINRLNRSITQIVNFMQMFSNNFLQFVITTIFALVAVALYSWPVALMLFALYPIYIFMTVRTSNTWQEYQAKKNHHMDIASGRFGETINQLKVVKSFIRERHELQFFGKQWQTVVDTNQPQSRYWHMRDFLRRLVLNVIFLLVWLYVFVSAAKGWITPGEAVALVLFAQQIRIPIFTISFLVENTQKAVADSKDYFEIMSLQPAIADIPSANKLRIGRGKIVFSDVHFNYDGGDKVLKGVDFEIDPGKRSSGLKVALVGESGEGKTTITSLLLRLYDVTGGQIIIDGQDIATVTQKSLRKNIAVVFQEPALFSGTIRENISYGKPGASQAEIEAAAKAANAHEFVSKFDKGYDTEIGEHGLKLSGGQKQRIAIARALLKDAPILILDEATSSLDSRSEQAVQQALEHLMKGRTTLIIAHRLSTIQAVDEIITLRNGRVDEVGTPDELARSGGIYDQLLQLQRTSSESTRKKLREFEIVK